MADLLSVGDAIGVLATIDWNGTTYKLSPPTPQVFARLEQRVAADVFAGAKESAAFDPGAIAEARKNIAVRWHRVGGPYWDAAFGTATGGVLQLWGMVAVNHPDFGFEDAKKMSREASEQVDLALLLAAPDFFTAAATHADKPPEQIAAGLEKVQEQVAKAKAERGL